MTMRATSAKVFAAAATATAWRRSASGALSHSFAVLLRFSARVGEGDGAGWAEAHLLLPTAERVAEDPSLPAFVVGAQEEAAAVRKPSGRGVGDLRSGQFVEASSQGVDSSVVSRSDHGSHQKRAL